MKCARARRLCGAYWDDEITQGEREWLESHLNACASCRTEYDSLARTLEALAAMPRVEPAPDLLDRTLASARRASSVPDRLPEPERRWVPAAAAAAAAVLVLAIVAPRAGWMPGSAPGTQVAQSPETETVFGPVAVARPVAVTPSSLGDGSRASDEAADAADFVALSGDSLFDHREDVEFILDPVALRRGRAHPLHSAGSTEGAQVERAVISF